MGIFVKILSTNYGIKFPKTLFYNSIHICKCTKASQLENHSI
jgi:hypothetical protein